MKSTLLTPLLTATSVLALPELSISKHDAHGRSFGITRGLRRRADGSGYLTTNVFDIASYTLGGAYYANVTVGTPPQKQVVILDTGSSDLYFDASTAATCKTTGTTACRGGTYDLSASSTYKQLYQSPAFNATYGDGSSAVGPYGSDVVGIGDVSIEGVQFGVAETIETSTGYSLGLIGLGYSAWEATDTNGEVPFYPNMPEVLVDSGVIASRLYSVYLNAEAEVSGSILFGGIDTSKFTGDLVTLDLLPSVYEGENSGTVNQFITTVTGVSVTASGTTTSIISGGINGVKGYENENTLPVLLDTGSSAWSVPSSFYDKIVQYFSFVDQYGLCSCSHQSDDITVSLEFGAARTITVTARELIVPYYNATTAKAIPYGDGTDTCTFNIAAAEDTGEGFQTLGDAVLQSMYVVFDLDNAQVSIAQANVNTTAEPSIVTVGAGPSGIASALSGKASYSAAANTNTWSIAPLAATTTFTASTAQSTIGEATGTAAEPADAINGATTSAAGSSSRSSSTTSSSAASPVSLPRMDWGPVWSMGVVVCMAALGVAVML